MAAMAASLNKTPTFLKLSTLPISQINPTSYLTLPRVPPSSRPLLCLARRRSNAGRPKTSLSKKKTTSSRKDSNQDDELGEDAFEALFKQLEEDLKNDDLLLDDDDDEISEEDLALLERELAEALAEDEELSQLLNVIDIDAIVQGEEKEVKGEVVVLEEEEEEEEEDDDDDEDDGDDDEEEEDEITYEITVDDEEEEEEDNEDDEVTYEIVVDDDDDEDEDNDDDDDEEQEQEQEEDETIKLRGWQLRRLAHALKVGRRKTSIKTLAAELCLDRAIVLELLRDPPPNLLMMIATLPDKPERPIVTVPSSEAAPSAAPEVTIKTTEPEPKVEAPIHVLQGSWSAKKRLKKAHINTLESVYRRTKRPTNAMISSIIQVTNLPRRRVVGWFEDKRLNEGVPEERHPYQRSSSESVLAQ